METNNIFMILILVLLGVILFRAIWPIIRPKPANEEIEKLIGAWVSLAVSSAYATAQKSKIELSGKEKKAVAMWLYDRLPDDIGGYNTTVLKETILTRELFSQMVEQAYRQAEALSLSYLGNIDRGEINDV